MSTPNRSICVYCSSRDALPDSHFDQARRLGTAIGERGDRLVWGGGRVGLMGEVARAVRDAGGETFGVIPESMTDREIADYEAHKLIVTETMRQRKERMDHEADVFIVLPGGFGTLEELAEVLVLRILHYHDRPIILVNADGFYDPLLALFDHYVQTGMASQKHRDIVQVVQDANDCYRLIDAYTPAEA